MGAGLSVELGHDSLHESNLRELEKALTHVKCQDREVTSLDLSNRFLGVAGARLAAEPLARAKALTRLNLSYNELGGPAKKKKYGRPRTPTPDEIGMPYLADGLARNASLLYLNLAGNNLGYKGTHCVSQVLRKNAVLEELSLFNNNITDECLPDLCDALNSNHSLLHLNLDCAVDYNEITEQGAQLLLGVFERNTTLISMSLKDNEGITEATLQAIEAGLARNRTGQAEERAAREEQIRQQRLREEAEARVRAVQEAAVQAERERVNAEYQELEERKRREAEEEARRRREAEQERAQKRAEREARQAAQQEHLDNLVNLAYAWRETLKGGERRGREWRSGFNTYKDTSCQGETFEPPEAPLQRRLMACWCEPTDQSVGYPGQLHYHCIYEPQPGDQFHDTGSHKYNGCHGTSHRCRSAPMSYQADHHPGELFSAMTNGY